MTVFCDAGPLGVATNPKLPEETIAMLQWIDTMLVAGHRLVVPAIADYEVRRELIRARKLRGLATLDAWNTAQSDRYLPLTDSALRLASHLWAQARNTGLATADNRELDGDVLIAAQVLDSGIPLTELIVVTVNKSHLSRFVPCDEWRNILP